MDHKTVEEYILSMPNAKLDYPFGDEVAVYKTFVSSRPVAAHIVSEQGAGEQASEVHASAVSETVEPSNAATVGKAGKSDGSAGAVSEPLRGEWKMFALIAEGKEPIRLSLKCDPQLSTVLREKYETVLPGYHLSKKHWNTIILTGQLPWDDIKGLILHSYNLVAGIN